MESNHNWYAVITADILLDKTLSDKQKLIMALIGNLSNQTGACFASNKYLADCLNCSVINLQQNVAILITKGYLMRELVDDERVLKTISPPIENNTPAPIKINMPPHIKINTHNNKEYNNKVINNKIKNDFSEKSEFVDVAIAEKKMHQKKLREKKVDATFKTCCDVWFAFHVKQKGFKPTWQTGVEPKHLKQIIAKLRMKFTEQNIEQTDEAVTASFYQLLESITDVWIIKNLQLSIINNKFDIIYGTAKHNTTEPTAAADFFNDFVNRSSSAK